MDSNSLRQLVWESEESAKLDFKIESYKIYEPKPTTQPEIQKWDKDRKEQWAELVKDIIALANGNLGTAGQTGYLIIGADDKLKADGTPTLRDVGNLALTSTEVLQKVNSYCDPRLPELQCEKVIVDGVNLFVISIPYFPYLYRLSKELKTKKEYSPYVVPLRRKDGEETYAASPIEVEVMENEKRGRNKPLSDWVKLEVDEEKVRLISKLELRHKSRLGCSIGLVGILLYFRIIVIPIFMVPNFTLQIWHLIFGLLLAIFLSYSLRPYSEAMNLYRKRPRNIEGSTFIGQNKFMANVSESNYLIYSLTADCLYPGCDAGKIIITYAPLREIPNLDQPFVGICSIAGKDHSYRVDQNWVAKRREFNWSDPNTKLG
jgi:hypothetical protein